MKNLITFHAILLLAIVSSCKKDNPTQNISTEAKKAEILGVRDSVSYTIDGKTYIANNEGTFTSGGNQGVNQKVVYNNNGTMLNWDIVGDKDSVLFYRGNLITSNTAYFQIFFAKKFNKKDLNGPNFYTPSRADVLKLYTGDQRYAEDFGRENAQNGIAILVSADNKSFSSYGPLPLQMKTSLKPGFQNNSSFKVISFTQTDVGGYNLEAKFSATVVDEFNENPKKLENGYLRLYVR
ncbi:hypothetical protein [Mucilaginibacter aquaedulcis]|uniref:hypothetical protein n=1 Tax=Mucilaginibacter aquaedulcis TaxID=1187081 RepID=UPI0025B46513|nr:hypothetical protein [Mucilaginibacter aquaedulcis]MDN3549885.1 hypothetical protein [Mucilaginibacter aquaedulcis]